MGQKFESVLLMFHYPDIRLIFPASTGFVSSIKILIENFQLLTNDLVEKM